MCCSELNFHKMMSSFRVIYALKFTIFWNVTSCVLVEVYRSFAGKYCLHLQGRVASQASDQQAEQAVSYFRLKSQFPAYGLLTGSLTRVKQI